MKLRYYVGSGVFLFFLLFMVLLFVRVETIYPGNVGILVPLYGKAKNQQDYNLVRGRVWYNPFYENVYIFPTFMQQVVWTQAKTESSPTDESITFQSSEGKSINCDVAVAYTITEEKITAVFQELRQTPEEITDGYLRSKVRDSFVRTGHTMKVGELLGSGVGELLTGAKHMLQEELGPKGFKFDMVSIVGKMRVDSEVETAIAATITAQQRAIEAENKVKQSEAEAHQAAAVAKGKSDAEIAEATGKARAKEMIAQAEAHANELLSKSITPELLQYQAIRQWDGKLPVYSGSPAPLPFVSMPQK